MSTVFDETYGRYAPAVLRYLRRLTRSRAIAEDLLQETFLRYHLQAQSDTALENTRAWLFRVATNLARDHERADLRAQIREQRYATPGRVIDFRDASEQRQAVRRALAALPVRMRQILLLQVEGFSYREMAEITGIAPGYVGVLLQRARAEFQRLYRQQDNEGRQQNHGMR